MSRFFSFCVALLLFASGIGQQSFIANQIMVLTDENSSIETVVKQLTSKARTPITLKQTLSERAHIFLLEFDSNSITANDMVRLAKSSPLIKLAQLNHTRIELRNTTPSDLEYPVQWSLGTTASARIFAPEAWDLSRDAVTATGDTIVLAIVDGGVDTNHIDLDFFKNKHEIPNNGIDDDHNGYIDDYHGWNAYNGSDTIVPDPHGTHVAGIAGAKTNNSEGIAGIVWGAKILPIGASSTTESTVIAGYGYALEMRAKYNESKGDSGAFVVATNTSFGVNFAKPSDYPIWCAFYDSLGKAGILNIAATTNGFINVDITGDIPTACPSEYMVAVSNIDVNGLLLGGYGATQIDLAAPGTNIRSTIPNHNYGNQTGTSMAAPHVTGVVGAMYSAMCIDMITSAHASPDSMALVVASFLRASVDTVDNLNGKNITSGRLNMLKALVLAQKDFCTEYSISVIHDWCAECIGQIPIQVSGEYSPYSVVIFDSNNVKTDSANNLCRGTYIVDIAGTGGFHIRDTLQVEGYDSLLIDYTVIPASNFTASNGSISLHISGGLPPYSYLWSTGDTSTSVTGLSGGMYSVTVSDANLCSIQTDIYVHSKDEQRIRIAPNPNSGSFTLRFRFDSSPATLMIYDMVGREVFTQKVPFAVNNMSVETHLPQGVYFVQIDNWIERFVIVR